MKKDIAKFVTATLIFILGAGITDFCVGKLFDNLMKKMPNEGERVAKSQYVINKVRADVVVIGSSRAECHYNSKILADKFACSVYNCAGDGQEFYYCNTAINSILNRYSPKIIIWDFKTGELAGGENENLSMLYPYYKTNDYIRKALVDHDGNSLKIKMLLNSYRYNGTAARILRAVYKPENALQNHYGYAPRPADNKNKVVPDDYAEGNLPLNPDKVKLLKETITLAKKKGVKIVIAVSPMYNKYDDENPSMTETRKICREMKVKFINDGQLSEFTHNNELAYDNGHLNSIGADRFTHILIKQIK